MKTVYRLKRRRFACTPLSPWTAFEIFAAQFRAAILLERDPMDRQEKEAFVAEIKEAFDEASLIVVARQTRKWDAGHTLYFSACVSTFFFRFMSDRYKGIVIWFPDSASGP